MRFTHISLRSVLMLGLVLGISAANAATTTQGSTLTERTVVDGDSGQVYIYTGGSFPAGTHLATFQYLFDFTGPEGNTTGYITPILFARTLRGGYTLYTVVGIGEGFHAVLGSLPRTAPFRVVEGLRVPTSDFWTFGFINAIVDSSGVARLMSPGTVDMDEFTDAGDGVGGAGTTNAWACTATGPPFPIVALGTTFGVYGSGADFTFFDTSRTYSAQASGIVTIP